MPKADNEMTKTEVLQFRATPITKLKLDHKKGSKSQSEALTDALNLYLNDNNNLLQQIHEGVNLTIQSQDDYKVLRHLYLNSRALYSDFADFENKHRQLKANVLKNIFRDFLLPTLERPIAEYEDNHHVDDPITE